MIDIVVFIEANGAARSNSESAVPAPKQGFLRFVKKCKDGKTIKKFNFDRWKLPYSVLWFAHLAIIFALLKSNV
jgi:hypothetical protein